MNDMPAIDPSTWNRLTEYHYWLIRHAYDRGRQEVEDGYGTPDDESREQIAELVKSRTRATLEGR